MPRDANGNYVLPAGNPVVSGTTIESTWANTTMSDIKQALTESLDRYGRGGMLAEFKFIDGTHAKPSITFTSEVGTGFYLAASKDLRVTISGVANDPMQWTENGVNVWNPTLAAWSRVASMADIAAIPAPDLTPYAKLSVANEFTADQTATNWKVKDRGNALHWSDPTFVSSFITTGTAAPPATGLPGQLYFQYEIG